jgi:energy-coupling factor transporter ATP-binding protein EcfA2
MVKLSRLQILRFRRVRAGTDLRFRNGLNLLLGRTGAGKTSLLDLISAVVTMDFSPLKDEELDLRFEALFDGDEISAHVAQVRSPESADAGPDGFVRSLELKLKPKGEADNLKVQVRSRQMTIERVGGVLYDGAAAFDPTVRPGMATLLDLVRQIASRQPLSQTRTLLAASRLGRAVRHDEALGFLERLFVDQPEIYVMPSEGTGPVALSFIAPEWILDGIAARLAAGEAPPYRIPAAEESSLPTVLASLGLESAAAVVELVEQAESGARRFRLAGLELRRSNGALVELRHLPFGHRRLLSLFSYLAANPNLALIDEVTNGLDARALKLAVDQLGRRQSFLTVAQPLLFESVDFESGEDVRRALTLCEETEGELVWSELEEKPANAFYRSWKQGPTEFATMLRSKGLW